MNFLTYKAGGTNGNIYIGRHSQSNNNFNLADPGGLSYYKGNNPGINGGFISNLVNVCTGCRTINESVQSNTTIYDFSIFPNPANDLLNIQSNYEKVEIKIRIFDAVGKLMNVVIETNNNLISINTSKLMPGIYFARIEFDNESLVKKFIIAE